MTKAEPHEGETASLPSEQVRSAAWICGSAHTALESNPTR